MTNVRLNGLALLYVHQNLSKQLDLDEMADNSAREHLRCMEFVNILIDEVQTVQLVEVDNVTNKS